MKIEYIWDAGLEVYVRTPPHASIDLSTPAEPNIIFVPSLITLINGAVYVGGPNGTN